MRRRRDQTEMSAAEYRERVGGEDAWQQDVKGIAAAAGWTVLMEIPDYGLSGLGALINRAKKGQIPRFPMKALLTLLGAISGWPDLTLGHTGKRRILFIEVKTNTGTVRPNQKAMIALLQSCGQDVTVARPRDEARLRSLLA